MASPKPRPITPGELLRARLKSGGVTQDMLADAIGVSRFTVNQIIRGRRELTPATALRLSRAFEMPPEFWLDLQRDVDLHDAREELGPALGVIRRVTRGQL